MSTEPEPMETIEEHRAMVDLMRRMRAAGMIA